MAIYLCAVSNDSPENYELGLKACAWGVSVKHRNRMRGVKKGDVLVFLVKGQFRSIHHIESDLYIDDAPVWPTLKDGDAYPFRIKLSAPIAEGNVPASALISRIRMFSAFAGSWGLAVQGPKGVFNRGLSEADLRLIQDSMKDVTTLRDVTLVVRATRIGEKLNRLDVYLGDVLIGEYERSQDADIERKRAEIKNASDLLVWVYEKFGQRFVVRWDGVHRRKSIRIGDHEVSIIPKALRETPSWEA